MKQHLLICAAAVITALALAPSARAAILFTQSDNVIGIDLGAASYSPGAEGSGNVVDQVPGPNSTKYLNFGKDETGFIVTPASGSSTVQSLQLRAANDFPTRDPLTYELYGTNSPIVTGENEIANQEPWNLIGSGSTGLDVDPGRHNLGSIVDFANSTAYESYKVVFPTLRDTVSASSMQVADVQLFTDTGGGGSAVLAVGDPTVGITDSTVKSLSSYPGGENPSLALDGDSSNKYLNFGGIDTGIIVNRADGKRALVETLTFTTANDAESRDPLTWALYGTDDPILSADNSRGIDESWTLIDTGITGFDVDPGRNATGATQAVAGATPYLTYRLVFPELRGGPGERLMQVAEISFEGQVVPEPCSAGLVGIVVVAGVVLIRRR